MLDSSAEISTLFWWSFSHALGLLSSPSSSAVFVYPLLPHALVILSSPRMRYLNPKKDSLNAEGVVGDEMRSPRERLGRFDPTAGTGTKGVEGVLFSIYHAFINVCGRFVGADPFVGEGVSSLSFPTPRLRPARNSPWRRPTSVWSRTGMTTVELGRPNAGPACGDIVGEESIPPLRW